MDRIAIIGAGVVGLACAVAFQRRGLHVLLIERDEPGLACSFGNAGLIAASEVFPIISPKHLRELPRMLLSKDAPASIRHEAFPGLLPWLFRAAGSLREARQRAIVENLSNLNRLSLAAWRDLLAHCDAGHLLSERGMLRLLRSTRGAAALGRHRAALAALSIPADMLSANEVRELEPHLAEAVVGALLHHGDAHVRNSLQVSHALLQRFVYGGGKVVQERALAIETAGEGMAVRTDQDLHAARKVIVAAGLQSAPLIEPLGVRAPLQAERGYHLMLRGGGNRISRPVTFEVESCVATPMGDSLRLAGTVEFAGRTSPPNWSRAERLAPIAGRYFRGALPLEGAERWMGERPSLPDSLPAIGRLAAHPAVGYAFGHQHLGLTQAAISAALLVQKMHDERTAIDLRPFDLARFRRW